MARPWSARCYGVARSRQNSIGSHLHTLIRARARFFLIGTYFEAGFFHLFELARTCKRRPPLWPRLDQYSLTYGAKIAPTARAIFLNSAQPSRGERQRNLQTATCTGRRPAMAPEPRHAASSYERCIEH
jgi:hypothetical protein